VTSISVAARAGEASRVKRTKSQAAIRWSIRRIIPTPERHPLLHRFEVSIQHDRDRCLAHYSLERSHQDYRLHGRTPAEALRASRGRDELPSLDFTNPEPEEETTNTTEITA